MRLGQDSNGSSDFRWGSFLSSLPTVPDAVAEAVQATIASIGPDAQPQLAIVFVTSEYSAQFDLVVPTLRQLLPSLKHIIGCSVRPNAWGALRHSSLPQGAQIVEAL